MRYLYLVESKFKNGMQKLKQYLHIDKQAQINVEIDNKRAIMGSCRLKGLSSKSYMHKVHYPHNTKQVIQYIKFIKGDIEIDEEMYRYIFRSCYSDNNFFIDRVKLRKELLLADSVFIELCSRKKYTKKGYYIHHAAADKGDAPSNNLIENKKFNEDYQLEIQSKDEIETDILEIIKLLNGKKVVFVTHIDYGIKIRKVLIDEILEICNKHSIPCVNPSDKIDVLKKEMKDSNHFSSLGFGILADYILEKSDNYQFNQKD